MELENAESTHLRNLIEPLKLVSWLINCTNWYDGYSVRQWPGRRGSNPRSTQKMVLDASFFNTQHYKVRIKGKMEQYRERGSALAYIFV